MPAPQQITAIAAYAGYFGRPMNAVVDDLESYAQLLGNWQRVQNLVSRETLGALWTRHFADSLQVLKLLRPEDTHVLDIGSGGGFPALPLAIASKGLDRRFTLIEPTARKASFLRTVVRETETDVAVHCCRIEQLDSRETLQINVITSRALADLRQLCAMVAPLWGPQTRAIFHKGREHVEELAQAGAHFDFDVLLTKSETDDSGVLVELRNLRSKTNA